MAYKTGHGDHWAALIDPQRVDAIIHDAPSTGIYLPIEKAELNIEGDSKTYEIQPIIVSNEDVTAKILYRRNEELIPIAAFPYIQCMMPSRHIVHQPHPYPSDCEGTIEHIGGSRTQCFYATDWISHKEQYEYCRTGDQLSLAGLAYCCEIVDEERAEWIKQDQRYYETRRTADKLSYNTVGYHVMEDSCDDYHYIAYVVNCIEDTYMGTPFYKMLICMDNRSGEPDFWLYARQALLPRKPQAGDLVYGTMWLQGTTKTNFQLITEKFINNMKEIVYKLKTNNTLSPNDLLKPLNHVQLMDGYTIDFATYEPKDEDDYRLGIHFYARKTTDERTKISKYYEAQRLPRIVSACRQRSFTNNYVCLDANATQPNPVYGMQWELNEYLYECYLLEISEFILYNMFRRTEKQWQAFTDFATLHTLNLELTRQRKPYTSNDFGSEAYAFSLQANNSVTHGRTEFYFFDCNKGLICRSMSAKIDSTTTAISFEKNFVSYTTKLKLKSDKKK